MITDQIDSAIVSSVPTADAGEDTARTHRRRITLGDVVGLVRSVAVIVLVALAILVILPAAMAAQSAASGG